MNFQQLMTEWPLQLCILVNPSQRFQENSFKYFTLVSGDKIQTLTITLTPPITLAWVCDQKSLRLESEGSVEEQLQHTIFLLRAELELTRKPLDFSRKFIRTGQMPKIIKRTAEKQNQMGSPLMEAPFSSTRWDVFIKDQIPWCVMLIMNYPELPHFMRI